jgi:hypothetical protein
MNERKDSVRTAAVTRTLEAIAGQLARGFIHHLIPTLRMPARLVCPSDEAEQAPAPAERLDAVTARLDGWRGGTADNSPSTLSTLLILRGFDVFGDDTHDEPTYPFRSKFQFDRKFLWLFVGRDASRMRFLFDSYQRPLYRAAAELTPKEWQLDR